MEPLLGIGDAPLLGRSKRATNLARLGIVFIITAAVMFVVSLSTTAIIHTQGFGHMKTRHMSADFGAWKVCYEIGNDRRCETIDSDCQFPVSVVPGAVNIQVQVVDQCGKWNAARGFLLLAAIGTGLAALLQMCVMCTERPNGIARWISAFFGIVGSIAGVVSLALFAYLRDHDDSFRLAHDAQLAYGFWLLVIGWALTFLVEGPLAVKMMSG